ncbi:hypothetical protein STAQ_40880 [Allostella sp. ATCC 35155]|nr:hypothetical protein STAQ_40880 [Stella sp. ATCC 35155]
MPPAPATPPFPAATDIVVIGGGIVGAAAALALARRRLRVVLVEKDRIAGQQSGRNWGFVRSQYRDPAELPLAVEALTLWSDFAREFGAAIGWRRTGCLFLAEDEAELARFRRWQEDCRAVAPDARILSPDAVRRLVPGLRRPGAGALHTPSDGQAEPALATAALAQAAATAGAVILEGCGAIAIERQGGRVAAVRTERGTIACEGVVCAAGAASHRFLAALGLRLPQQVVRSTVSLTTPLPAIADPCFCGFGLGLRQRADGSCIIAPDSRSDVDLTLDSLRGARFFLPELMRMRRSFALRLGRAFVDDLALRLTARADRRMVEPRRPAIPANERLVAESLRRLQDLFPGAAGARIARSWAGRIDVLPDALPVIDAPAEVPGLVVATGFSGHGFGLAPSAGRHAAALAAGEAPGAAIRPFRLDRFARGTHGRPHAPL